MYAWNCYKSMTPGNSQPFFKSPPVLPSKSLSQSKCPPPMACKLETCALHPVQRCEWSSSIKDRLTSVRPLGTCKRRALQSSMLELWLSLHVFIDATSITQATDSRACWSLPVLRSGPSSVILQLQLVRFCYPCTLFD